MKILVGMPSKDSWGGPIASEPPFVEALRELGAEVREETYVYGDKEKPTPFFQRVNRVLKTAYRFQQILRHEDFEIIHLNTAFDLKTVLRDVASIRLMQAKKAKIFLKIHGTETKILQDKNPFIRLLINYLKNRVDGFGVHTSEEKKDFLRAGFPEDKFYFVKNAILLEQIIPQNENNLLKKADERFQLLFVSRFIPTKGLLETIRAVKVLIDNGFDVVLNCIGDGEVRAEAENEVKNLSLQDVVKFTGYIPETKVAKYFSTCDFLVFPTRHSEGFPNVLFKAVAAGMPIVTTKIRAAADYLNEPENCLFSTQNPADIAEKIVQLIENPTLLTEMHKNNLAFGKTLAPVEIAKEFMEIYQRILSKN
jgi:glycosyltransferase involved in cell wall biosynthesis